MKIILLTKSETLVEISSPIAKSLKSKKRVLELNALFRIPKPSYPGYLQYDIHEILRLVDEQRDPLMKKTLLAQKLMGFH